MLTPLPLGFSQYIPQKVVILEPLSATGLRSIRYAQEIPLVKSVVSYLHFRALYE